MSDSVVSISSLSKRFGEIDAVHDLTWISTGTSVLLTTHYLEEANMLCDRIGILNEGRLVALGSPEQVRAGFLPTLTSSISDSGRWRTLPAWS